jgi:hypothetical protein
MCTIPQVARAMQTVLTTKADAVAKATKFVQRESKMTGAIFTQTLVFGWLAKPQSSLSRPQIQRQRAALSGTNLRSTESGRVDANRRHPGDQD